MTNILNRSYNPKEIEDKLYSNWMEKKYFHAKVDKNKKPFTIVIPPPNITGQLHMGHALDNTMQDIIIRMKRMQGYSALWLPGTDHASIATEAKIVAAMREEGISKKDLGREKFLERAWEWKETYGTRIVKQLKKLGSSCDWDRERFTLDEGLSEAVTKVFVKLYNDGLIYRGKRIINWCPVCNTSISNAEVEFADHEGNFWHIKYPIKDSKEFLTVATTRPETMLGDTAVAVHPDDERYKDLVGKTIILPLLNREIPIIADSYVEKDFGTGVVKITPAHDPNDFAVGKRHNLEQICVMNNNATMNENAGKYQGLDRYDARKAIVKDIEELGLLEKIEKHKHNVGGCYRCSTTVEPMLSLQWFVKMAPLAEPALEVVKNDTTEFVPKRFEKTYFNWMENIQDWCISRQLWWGHRIPAYYCQDCSETIVSATLPTKCPKCQSSNIVQDEDSLDTWFSSALWPFSTLGWPNDTEDFNYFYPTNVLVTGYDIIFFWVARMIFSGLAHTGKTPFDKVLIHGLVRDADGRKMSKSLGNGIDPLVVIEEHGTDALRFALTIGNSPGNDLRYSEEKIKSAGNFANKIWNATKFALMNFDENVDLTKVNKEKFTSADKWILSKMNDLIKDVTENMEKFELGIALQKLYEFIWEEFCDWYIELIKPRLYDKDNETRIEAQYVLNDVLGKSMKLLHPYMPFVTEEIYLSLINDDESIMISDWPLFDESMNYKVEEENMNYVMTAIKGIRNVRASINVPPSKKASLIFVTKDESIKNVLLKADSYFKKLAGASNVEIQEDNTDIPDNAVSYIMDKAIAYMPLAELVDISKEIERLKKEKEKLEDEVKRAKGKLKNERFVQKAPEKLVLEEKEKLEKYSKMLEQVQKSIDIMEKA